MTDVTLVEATYSNLDEGLAAACTAHEQHGLEAALRLLARLREQYPDSLAATYQANRMLIDAGRLNDADLWLSEACGRFPRDLSLASQHARSAQRRRDFDEAARRWQAVREEFPDDPGGDIGLTATLRESAQFDIAEAVATAALKRFPDVPALLVEHAFVAHMRQDWVIAARRWDAARARQPEHHIGYVLGAQCLRTCGQVDAAEALLRAAIERFPTLAVPLVEFAWTAHVRGDWVTALDRWEAVRVRFPDEVARYTGAAKALRELQRLDEAEALLGAAVTRFPNELGLLHEYAGLAHDRRDWPEAVRRWTRLRDQHPLNPLGYQAGSAALREAGRLDDAEALLAGAVQRFPDHVPTLADYASIAQARSDWMTAAHRWEQLCQVAPGNPQGYSAGALALCEAHQFTAAEALLEDAMRRIPQAQQPFLDYAGIATKRGDWDVALRRLMEARRRFPGAADIMQALHEAQLRAGAQGADLAAEETRTAGSPDVAPVAIPEQDKSAPISETVANAPIEEAPHTGWSQIVGSIFPRKI